MLQNPALIAFGVVALIFSVLHSVTFFQTTPKILVIRIGEKRIPEAVIVWGQLFCWLAVSILIGWAVL